MLVVACSVPKAAKVLKFPLKPLALHTKLHGLSEEQSSRKRNRIRFTGPSLSLSTVLDWAHTLLPELPVRLPEETAEARFFFVSAFTGAVAVCEVRRGELLLESENASAVAIAKEQISRLATQSRVQVSEQVQ